MLHEKTVDSECIGKVSIPTAPGKGDVIPINLSPTQLKLIHARLVT